MKEWIDEENPSPSDEAYYTAQVRLLDKLRTEGIKHD